MKILRDDQGQATILTGLFLACLLGTAGLAVDVGTMFRAKRVLQTAADAAAIAGAAEANYGHAQLAAKAASSQNGITDGSNGATVTVNYPTPQYGPFVTDTADTYIEVIVSQAEPTYFMKLFHLSSMTVSARAVATLGPSDGCITTLNTSGNDIGLSGSGNLNMPGCGILVNASSSNALTISNNATLTASSIGVVGGYTGGSGGNLNPLPVTGIAPAPNPLAWESAPSYTPSSCLPDPKLNSSSGSTIGPSTPGGVACYSGLTISGTGPVTMNPGTYVITGTFSASGSGTLSGSGITIYLAGPNGSLSLTGSGALSLTAPTSGTYNGILVYEDPSDTNSLKIAGSSGSDMEGIVYAPNASMTLSGSSGATFYTDLVVGALSVTGSNNLQNYATKNNKTPLTMPRLVE